MSLTGGSKFILTGGASQYQIARSLRFRASNSAYLSRTPSASNRKTWTWSGWVKRDQTVSGSTGDNIFGCHAATTDAGRLQFFFGSGSGFTADAFYISGHSTDWRVTTQLFRDFAGWYHIVVAWDTTQSTAANRVKLYVNGTQVTSFATSNDPTLNADYGINQASAHYLGTGYNIAGSAISGPMDGYLSEVNFIDGQALTPSSFGQTDATTGAWNPIKYTGTYGTNGFYLPFSDNSAATSTTIGKDSSGNGNNWTPSGISITAGVTNDSLVDTPTNYGSDTGAGGEVRGNYCTWDPLRGSTNHTFSEGNLKATSNSNVNNNECVGTIHAGSGKFHCEFTIGAGDRWDVALTGIEANAPSQVTATTLLRNSPAGFYYGYNGVAYLNGNAQSGTWATFTVNDVISFDVDVTNLTLAVKKNGVATGVQVTLPSGYRWSPSASIWNSSALYLNCGQRAFTHITTGYKALCTQNLPDPAIGATATTLANKYFDTTLYTGSSGTVTKTGIGFQPDLLWFKDRAVGGSGQNHKLVDSVRGSAYGHSTNAVTAQSTDSIATITTDGFSLVTGSRSYSDTNADSYVAWLFRAGGNANTFNVDGTGYASMAAAGITDGDIALTGLSVNRTAGVSIVRYTGTGAATKTIAHGLGVAPKFVIQKAASDGTYGWNSWHTGLSAGYYISLASTGGQDNSVSIWPSSPAGTSFMTTGSATGPAYANITSATHILYCFAEVAGFSKFGSYTGNGSTDGPFVWCGFRPRFIMVKRTDSTGNWYIKDTARDTYNPAINGLYGNLNNAEDQDPTGYFDLLSNGFKARGAYGTMNASGGTYIFAAFAESPFKTARAR